MTYPEGRQPLSWDDVMGVKHVSHPSTWEAEAKALRARVQELEAFATECASYTCTCHEAYVGRQMVDPSCMAGEIGYEAQEVLGQPVTCRGILAARPRWAALQKQEGGE